MSFIRKAPTIFRFEPDEKLMQKKRHTQQVKGLVISFLVRAIPFKRVWEGR